jgi:hypothetical protein
MGDITLSIPAYAVRKKFTGRKPFLIRCHKIEEGRDAGKFAITVYYIGRFGRSQDILLRDVIEHEPKGNRALFLAARQLFEEKQYGNNWQIVPGS